MKLSDGLKIYSTNGNLIRTIFAFAVIIHHAFYLSANSYDPLYVITNGQVGLGGFAVCVFFFFSGMYVCKSINISNSVKSFLYKRCKRIFPQLWVVVLCSVIILGPIFSSLNFLDYFTNTQTYKYFLNCFFVPIHELPGVFDNNIYGNTVNGALWTLPVEFACYISLVVVMIVAKQIFIKSPQKISRILYVVGLAVSVAVLVYSDINDNKFLISVSMAVVMFFIGTLYFEFSNNVKLNFVVFIICVICLFCSALLQVFQWGIFLFLPYTLIYLSLGIKQIPQKTKLLTYSYEIYLIGFPVQQAIVSIYGGSMQIYINIIISLIVVVTFIICWNLIRYIINMIR